MLEGYADLEKNRKEATKYFREAAEGGVPDAQVHYTYILLDDSKNLKNGPDPDTLKQILHYFTLAADNKNASAWYLLGSLYKHEKGLYYIKLAAIQKHHKAIALLKEVGEDPYQWMSRITIITDPFREVFIIYLFIYFSFLLCTTFMQ